MVAIGSTRRTAGQLFQQFGLAPFRAILTPRDFAVAAVEGGCPARRRRALIPEVVAWLIMYVGLCSCSMTQGLLHAWGLLRGVCPWLRDQAVTEEAFCLARSRVRLGFWRALWETLILRFQHRFAPAMRWKGRFRLLGADGTEVDLPNVLALGRFFGRPKGPTG